MSGAEHLELSNNKETTKEKTNRNLLAARRRQQRMRNLNMTYTKTRKRRKLSMNPGRNNAVANALPKAESSSLSVESVMVYRCPYCTFWHRTLDGFHAHISKKHANNTRLYQCTYCHLTSDSRDEIFGHINQLEEADSVHKRATCLILSKNLIERYAAYLKTTEVPSSANYGKLPKNSDEVNQTDKNKNVVTQPNITKLSQEETNSSSIQDEDDILFFPDSPISAFPDTLISTPFSDGSVMNSSKAQSFIIRLEKEDPLESNSKKKQKYEHMNNNVLISSKQRETENHLNTLFGIQPMEIESKVNLLRPMSRNKRKLSDQHPQSGNSSSANFYMGDSGTDDSDACIPTSSSEYSDWLTDRGTALEPPKNIKRKVSKPRSGGWMGATQKKFRPAPCSVVPRRLPFYPQMGDEVVYFRQGHELYLDAVKQKKLYKINQSSLPWHNKLIREQELVKIISINYEIKTPIRLYCLKLGLMDPTTKLLTGETFSLKYHDVEGVLDFLVLQQDFDLAILRTWQPGDCFRSIINDGYGEQMWWEGHIEACEPLSDQYPNSQFLCYRVRWSNNEIDRASPWDLERVDLERMPPRPWAKVPALPTEIASLLYKPHAEDWPPVGDRDSECDRISSGFSKVMDMYVAKHFATPVNLDLYPTYASMVKYPMDLSTIKARLENRFYRRVTSVQYDVRRIHINAYKFNLPTSDIVRNASIISDLCLEIIGNRDSDDVKAMCREIKEKYRILDEEEEKAAERSKKAEPSKSLENINKNRIATPALTFATNWRQQCDDLIKMLNRLEGAAWCRALLRIPEVPTSSQVVDLQMDFQTVREKLRLNNYLTPMGFAKDVRFILDTSRDSYSDKESPNLAKIVRLSDVFEEHYSKILSSLKPSKNTARKSMNSSSKDDMSRKGKSLAPTSSANEFSKGLENSKVIPSKREDQIASKPSSSFVPGHEQLCVHIPALDNIVNLNVEIPDTITTDSFAISILHDKGFLQNTTPLLNEKEQLNVDIENGFRNLKLIDAELKKDMQLLSEQQHKIDALYGKLFQRREATDNPDGESSSPILQLTSLTDLGEKIRGQLLVCKKERLTQELRWREQQATLLKLELQLNSLDPNENALEFKTVGEILVETRNQEKQSENRLNSIKAEIASLEREQQNLNCKISDVNAMHDKLAGMKAIKASMETQILMKKSKKNDIISDLNKWISAWKEMEMKIIDVLYQEAVGDIEKMANERFNKLEQVVKCALKPNGATSTQLPS
ncbi:PH-interacting protein-like isoform X1 [Daphnia pulicaria]|uniref:PH-interacting protein-like isoform X1 n=1 Tax=Daphnia pulicaria TaxID=35523 RepID=UPI001EEB283B|nr:PH-interacting protein-like isoform X1 [Daphnia pulicaria]